MAERVRVREVDDDGGQRLLRTVRRDSGPVVTWRRAQTALPPRTSPPGARIAAFIPGQTMITKAFYRDNNKKSS